MEAQRDVQATAMHAIELQQTRGSAQRLVLLKTGLNDMRPNQFWTNKITGNLYELAASLAHRLLEHIPVSQEGWLKPHLWLCNLEFVCISPCLPQ